jgi:hypothetical protein
MEATPMVPSDPLDRCADCGGLIPLIPIQVWENTFICVDCYLLRLSEVERANAVLAAQEIVREHQLTLDDQAAPALFSGGRRI